MEPAKSGPYAMKEEPPIWNEFRKIFKDEGIDVELDLLGVQEFYDQAEGDDVAITIATGDQRWYSNILLTIGAVPAK